MQNKLKMKTPYTLYPQ